MAEQVKVEPNGQEQGPSPQSMAGITPPAMLKKTMGNMSVVWKEWKRRFESYLYAANIERAADSRKIHLVLHYADAEVRRLFYTFGLDPAEATFKDVIAKFDEHFIPQVNVTMECHNFFTRRQQENESLEDYLTAVKTLAQTCEFEKLDDPAKIRDILTKHVWIAGLNQKHKYIMEKLISKDEQELDKAVKLALRMKQASQHAANLSDENFIGAAFAQNVANKQYSAQNNQQRPQQQQQYGQQQQQQATQGEKQGFNRPAAGRGRGQQRRQRNDDGVNGPCGRCGQMHRTRCPAMGCTCSKCGGLNHYAQCCRTQARRMYCVTANTADEQPAQQWLAQPVSQMLAIQPSSTSQQNQSMYLATNQQDQQQQVQVIPSDAVFMRPLFSGAMASRPRKLKFFSADIAKCSVSILADTGSEINIIQRSTVEGMRMAGLITPPTNQVFTVNNIPVEIYGKITVPIQINGRDDTITFQVVEFDSPIIMGLEDLERLALVYFTFAVSSAPALAIQNEEKVPQQEIVSSNKLSFELKSYEDVFDGLGCLPRKIKLSVDESISPTIDCQRRLPFKLINKIQDELKTMEKNKIISKIDEPTSWVSSMVVVEKNDHTLRICIDPRKLNKAIRRPHFEIPSFEFIKSRLSGSVVFSTLDANKGFWMLQLDDYSSKLCTFNTPFGRYRFLRLPFGINAASEIFQREMYFYFGHLSNILFYIDDFIVFGKTQGEHDIALKNLLETARKIGLRFNPKKSKINVPEVKYLGHIFSKLGIKVDSEKVAAVQKMEPPKNVEELQRFLGLINYVGAFIQNLQLHTSHLRTLLKKDSIWSWNHEHASEFQILKNLISQAPVLTYFDPSKPITLSVDSSKDALGACLLHSKNPIAYASITLNTTQQNYPQIQKELLAIFFGCEKFHQFIYGYDITVETDHKPLEILFKKALGQVPAGCQRIMMKLLIYKLNVIYIPGKKLLIADTLSRAKMSSSEVLDEVSSDISLHINMLFSSLAISKDRLERIKLYTTQDFELTELKKLHDFGWPNKKQNWPVIIQNYFSFHEEIHFEDEICFKNMSVVVPVALRLEMLRIIHASHQGVSKCLAQARDVVFWPGMTADIKKLVENCDLCTTFQRNKPRAPIIFHELGEYPFEKVGADFLEFQGVDYLYVIDYFSKFVELALIRNKTADYVIPLLKSSFARYGSPMIFVSDGGPPWNAKTLNEFLCDWDVRHILTSPLYPQSNGQVERAIGNLKMILTKAQDPYMGLLQYRNTPNITSYSPAQLLMSRNLRTKLPILKERLRAMPIDYDKYLKDVTQVQQKIRDRYDAHAIGKEIVLSPGQKVYYKKELSGIWLKGEVVSINDENPRSYIVRDCENGKTYKRNIQFILNKIHSENDTEVQNNRSNVTSEPKKNEMSVIRDQFRPFPDPICFFDVDYPPDEIQHEMDSFHSANSSLLEIEEKDSSIINVIRETRAGVIVEAEIANFEALLSNFESGSNCNEINNFVTERESDVGLTGVGSGVDVEEIQVPNDEVVLPEVGNDASLVVIPELEDDDVRSDSSADGSLGKAKATGLGKRSRKPTIRYGYETA